MNGYAVERENAGGPDGEWCSETTSMAFDWTVGVGMKGAGRWAKDGDASTGTERVKRAE